MSEDHFDLDEEKKMLVLERFKTLNPELKIMLGNNQEMTMKELINHVEKGDEFGKRVVAVQMKMLQAFSK